MNACAAGGDNGAKGTSASLAMTLYRSLELNKKEIVKKAIKTGEIILIPEDKDANIDQMNVLESIMELVAMDSAVHIIKRVVLLNKEVHSCIRKPNETIGEYVERFGGSAQSYLNLVNANQNYADNQNFAIVLPTNARVSSQTFTNLISSLVGTAKNRNLNTNTEITLTKERLSMIITILDDIYAEDEKLVLKKECVTNVKQCSEAIKSAIAAQELISTTSETNSYIGLQDAINALEEAALQEKDLEECPKIVSEEKPKSGALMGSYSHRPSEHRQNTSGRFYRHNGFRNKKFHWGNNPKYSRSAGFRSENHETYNDRDPDMTDLREQLSKKHKPSDMNGNSTKYVSCDRSPGTEHKRSYRENEKQGRNQYFQ